VTDKITSARRSENMRRIRSKDTVPEMRVRRLLHSLGYRYRLHDKQLPGKPDLVFPARKRVVLVHGCFFHQHSGCIDGRVPKSRQEYWGPKLERNISRDKSNRARLSRLGWRSLVVWDCETMDVERLKTRLVNFLETN
jgi:DNA mismatch endonuclease, patch repair protein